MGSHSFSYHPTQVNAPRLPPAMQAGTWFSYPGGMEGWVDVVDLIAPRPGVEPASPTLNRCTTKTTCNVSVIRGFDNLILNVTWWPRLFHINASSGYMTTSPTCPQDIWQRCQPLFISAAFVICIPIDQICWTRSILSDEKERDHWPVHDNFSRTWRPLRTSNKCYNIELNGNYFWRIGVH